MDRQSVINRHSPIQSESTYITNPANLKECSHSQKRTKHSRFMRKSSKIEQDVIHVRVPRVLSRRIRLEARIPALVFFDPLDDGRLPSVLGNFDLGTLELVVTLIHKLLVHFGVVGHQPGPQKAASAFTKSVGIVRWCAIRDPEGGAGVSITEVVSL
jgi:hypothetical protein